MAETEVIHFPWRGQLRVCLPFPDQLPFESVCLCLPVCPVIAKARAPFAVVLATHRQEEGMANETGAFSTDC
jgi:hypothetical protein